ncbi:MAG TPA: CorA family divalent cation transporter [Dokdonella sp.]
MLSCQGIDGNTLTPAADGELPPGCVWFDLKDPSEDETRRVERATALELPSQEQIRAVEMSSRVRFEDGALYLNVPYFAHDGDQPPTPVGLIVTPKTLVSIRYAESAAFGIAAAALHAAKERSGASAFTALVGAIVGQIADHMEAITAKTGALSLRILGDQKHTTKMLRATLSEVGYLESHLTRTRLTMTGLLRIIVFTHESAPEWIAKPEAARLKLAHKDLDVLCELDAQLTDKLQFLLDAVLGFISIDQNDVMKIFTVASVASIPPIILVGIWGMNFVNMPELKWPHGYPMALTAIALSVIIPVLWFKRRGWL